MTHETEPKKCTHEGCTASYKPHRWGSIKAHAEGWLIMKDGRAYCPDHLPLWAQRWREDIQRKTSGSE